MSSKTFTVHRHVFPGQHVRQYAGATRYREEDPQLLEAKQYTPSSNQLPQEGDVTIIATCAVSFPKEMYEPLGDDLLMHCENEGLRIRSIWCVDKSDHGASAVLNENTQGDDPSYADLARDLLHMINTFRDQMTLPIVGIGHSMGATAILELARIHPRLFSSVVLMDPVLGLCPSVMNAGVTLVYSSSKRKDLWHSREEAESAFKSADSLQNWDPRVMRIWLAFGLRDTPTRLHPDPGKVTLTTSKATEAWNYARSWFDPLPNDGARFTQRSKRAMAKYPDGTDYIRVTHPFYLTQAVQAWDDLPRLRSSVLYIFPDSGPLSTPDARAKKLARTGSGPGGSGGEKSGMAQMVIVKKTSHLLPFEKPAKCASVIVRWLVDDLEAWRERRTSERENRDDKSVDKVALSDEWIRRARLWYEKHMGQVKAKL